MADDIGDMAADDWEWPAEGVQRSPYYVPNRVETMEPPAPNPEPRLIKRGPVATGAAATEDSASAGAPPAAKTLHITDYAWVDDGLVVKVYMTMPGVTKELASCEFRDEGVDFRAEVRSYKTGQSRLRGARHGSEVRRRRLD